ncbi:MAG: hypothetical protein KDK91_02270 [Gammaproteobacteria bacterium]|nr:hypothetical protein [Gammaproteobacteria bacterium]
MHVLEVFDPSGATEVTQLHAPRLTQLSGKTIGFLSNDMWQAHRMLPALREWLTSQHDDITLIAENEFPMGNNAIDTEETVDLLQSRGVDAVIIGNAS